VLQYQKLVLGELATNCYLLWEEKTKETAIIDPADDGVGISEEVERLRLIPKAIWATHGHFDHVLGALDLKLIYNIPFCCSGKDQFLLERQQETARFFLGREIKIPNFKKIDLDLDDTPKLLVGEEEVEVVSTPGHTPGGTSFYYPKDRLLLSGDTLFAGGEVGRTDLSYSSAVELDKSVAKLQNYLSLGAILLPGHGEIG